jgi:L-histidine Nalpha-methyltransferase
MQCSGRRAEFAADVARDLGKAPKQLQAKYLYDSLGSRLFDAICRLPWYRIPRAEHRLIAAHADEVAAAIVPSPGAPRVTVIELGCGSGDKLARFAHVLAARTPSADVHLVDISDRALRAAARRLQRFRSLRVWRHQATYEEGLARAAAARGTGPAIALFLGSNIGNFDPPDAEALLRQIRSALRDGDVLLLGADLVKPERDLLLAYDDPLGVTAAFDKNLLVRINRELGGAFDLSTFAHQARWHAPAGRIEMHLVSRVAQRVPIAAIEATIAFEAGESIWTESSYKYDPGQIAAMGAAGGLSVAAQWIDERARFALTLFAR